jgi:hypothetical protein
LKGEIAKVDGKPIFQIIYTEGGCLVRSNNDFDRGKTVLLNEPMYLLLKPISGESFPNPLQTVDYETDGLNNQINLLLGLRFEKFANENGFLCHTAHYNKYFGKDIESNK